MVEGVALRRGPRDTHITSRPHLKVDRVTTPHNDLDLGLTWDLKGRLGAMLGEVGVSFVTRSEAFVRRGRAGTSGSARLARTYDGRLPARPRIGLVLPPREARAGRRDGLRLLLLPVLVRPPLELLVLELAAQELPSLEFLPLVLLLLVLPLRRQASLRLGRGRCTRTRTRVRSRARMTRGPNPGVNSIQSDRAGLVLESPVILLLFAGSPEPRSQWNQNAPAEYNEQADADDRQADNDKSYGKFDTRVSVRTGGECATLMNVERCHGGRSEWCDLPVFSLMVLAIEPRWLAASVCGVSDGLL